VNITVQNLAPVVNNVSYSGAIGNTSFGVGLTPTQPETHATGTVLSGSSDANNDALTAGPPSIPSTNLATVSMNANATSTDITAAGFGGASDTFTFTVSDGHGGSTNGTATINLTNRVWYVNNALASNGDGRSTAPFNTLTNVNGASDADSPND